MKELLDERDFQRY